MVDFRQMTDEEIWRNEEVSWIAAHKSKWMEWWRLVSSSLNKKKISKYTQWIFSIILHNILKVANLWHNTGGSQNRHYLPYKTWCVIALQDVLCVCTLLWICRLCILKLRDFWLLESLEYTSDSSPSCALRQRKTYLCASICLHCGIQEHKN